MSRGSEVEAYHEWEKAQDVESGHEISRKNLE